MPQLTEIQSAQRSLEESFNRRMMELEAQLHSGVPAKDTVARVADEFRTFRELMFKMLGLLRKQISDCQRQVDDLESRQRRKNLLFLGISEAEGEDCSASILDLVHKKLGIETVSSEDIRVCHRIGTSNKDHPRPILVRFADLKSRNLIWRAKPALKGSSVSVREFLTRTRQTIFGKARQHFGMRAVWTQDGIIIIKTTDGHRHKITYLDQLLQLLEKHPRAVGNTSSTANNSGNTSSK